VSTVVFYFDKKSQFLGHTGPVLDASGNSERVPQDEILETGNRDREPSHAATALVHRVPAPAQVAHKLVPSGLWIGSVRPS
jgi:hypothetical protein